MTDNTQALVQTRIEDRIAIVTMVDPKRRNPFSLAVRAGLLEAFSSLYRDPGCAAIVLTGAGGHFCSGGDISEMGAVGVIEGRNRMVATTDLARLIVTGQKPVIAAVEGFAIGAGVSLTAAADFAVASREARFGCAFIKVGLLPDTGALWTVPRKVGPGKAMELFGLGEQFDAAEAHRIGLVNRLAEPGGALEAAVEVARKYAALPLASFAVLKGVLSKASASLEDALHAETALQPMLKYTDDHREAVAAFMEKRPPRFTGR
ncbi:MAG: enoyl-CoA hydratase/isomerase family protein [Gammaproteobacteria bacterium]